ncbi:MAG: hypothetical protein ABIG34_03495 [Candidatus Peregrinibacteria bacterium]
MKKIGIGAGVLALGGTGVGYLATREPRGFDLEEEKTEEDIWEGMPEIYKGQEKMWEDLGPDGRKKMRKQMSGWKKEGVVDTKGMSTETGGEMAKKEPEGWWAWAKEQAGEKLYWPDLVARVSAPAATEIVLRVLQHIRRNNSRERAEQYSRTELGDDKNRNRYHGSPYDDIPLESLSSTQLHKLREEVLSSKRKFRRETKTVERKIVTERTVAYSAIAAVELITNLTYAGLISEQMVANIVGGCLGYGTVKLGRVFASASEDTIEDELDKVVTDIDDILPTVKEREEHASRTEKAAEEKGKRDELRGETQEEKKLERREARRDATIAHKRELARLEKQAELEAKKNAPKIAKPGDPEWKG